MNPAQKAYESYDLTLINLKRSQSLYHFRNLNLIKSRKAQYNEKPPKSGKVNVGELSSKLFN
ncbi:MAG: hypothetical protein MJ252_18010 [archaeon]|nr:hypothetical protein [archaeon]